MADFLYTVQLVISDGCTKFQISRSSSFGEIFDENFHMHYPGVMEKGKHRKRTQHLSFVYSNTLGCPHCVNKI